MPDKMRIDRRRDALEFLKQHGPATGAQIGKVIAPDQRRRSAASLGGKIGNRLVRLGWAKKTRDGKYVTLSKVV